MKIRNVTGVLRRCTKDNPMPFEISALERSRWTHPDMAVVDDTKPLFTVYECPHCEEIRKDAKSQ